MDSAYSRNNSNSLIKHEMKFKRKQLARRASDDVLCVRKGSRVLEYSINSHKVIVCVLSNHFGLNTRGQQQYLCEFS